MTSPASSAPESRPRPHLAAALGALSLLVLAALGFDRWATRLERDAFPGMVPLFAQSKERDASDRPGILSIEHLKNQGLALQRRGFEQRDILPLYGSSELVKRIPEKSSLFFQDAPSGFRVLPIGRAGTTSLIILQKIGAAGADTRRRRVAISVSPSWFFPGPNRDWAYEGNVSLQQTLASLLNPALSPALKHDFARRLLARPAPFEHEPMLRFLLTRLARGGPLDRAAVAAAWPLARLHQAVDALQDHFEIALFVDAFRHLLAHPPKTIPPQLDWDRLLAQAASQSGPAIDDSRKAFEDQAFRTMTEQSPEWEDFELLLRGLHEMGVRTLVLRMPPNGVYWQRIGVSRETLDLFAARLRALATQYGAHIEAFEEHTEDDRFFVDHHDHLSAKGWMYYNRALDQFYHRAESKHGVATPHQPRPHTAARRSVCAGVAA